MSSGLVPHLKEVVDSSHSDQKKEWTSVLGRLFGDSNITLSCITKRLKTYFG